MAENYNNLHGGNMLLRKASNFKFKRRDIDSSRRAGRIRETFVDFLPRGTCENCDEFKILIKLLCHFKNNGKGIFVRTTSSYGLLCRS